MCCAHDSGPRGHALYPLSKVCETDKVMGVGRQEKRVEVEAWKRDGGQGKLQAMRERRRCFKSEADVAHVMNHLHLALLPSDV